MSNVLAAIGRGQLRAFPERIAERRRNFENYRAALATLPGIEFMPLAPYGTGDFWLTCITIDPARFGASGDDVRLALKAYGPVALISVDRSEPHLFRIEQDLQLHVSWRISRSNLTWSGSSLSRQTRPSIPPT